MCKAINWERRVNMMGEIKRDGTVYGEEITLEALCGINEKQPPSVFLEDQTCSSVFFYGVIDFAINVIKNDNAIKLVQGIISNGHVQVDSSMQFYLSQLGAGYFNPMIITYLSSNKQELIESFTEMLDDFNLENSNRTCQPSDLEALCKNLYLSKYTNERFEDEVCSSSFFTGVFDLIYAVAMGYKDISWIRKATHEDVLLESIIQSIAPGDDNGLRSGFLEYMSGDKHNIINQIKKEFYSTLGKYASVPDINELDCGLVMEVLGLANFAVLSLLPAIDEVA